MYSFLLSLTQMVHNATKFHFSTDAVTVVLYHLFEALAGFDVVAYKEV